MNTVPAAGARYGLLPLFLMAAVFAWAAPEFWNNVEIHPGNVADAHENEDLYQGIYPTLSYGFGRLRTGEVPFWNPRQLCGLPFQADPRTGLFQPLNAVFLLRPTEQAMAIHAFLCLFLGAFSFALFARSLNARYLPALLGGFVYGFCGVSAAAMSRPSVAASLVWIPVAFWAIREYSLRARYSGAVLAGVAGACMILSGCFAAAVTTFLLAAPYMLASATLHPGPPRPSLPRRLLSVAVMVFVALAVSAVQWLPTLIWLEELPDPAAAFWSMDFAGQMPGSFRDLLKQAFMSPPGMLPRIGYMGIPALVLIPAALCHKPRRWHALYFLAAGVFLPVVAVVGGAWLPFGLPSEALVLGVPLCFAVLATLGADRLFVPRASHRAPTIWFPATLVVIACVLLFLFSAPPVRGRLVLLLLALIPFIVARTRSLAVFSGLAMAVILFVDLGAANRNAYQHPYQDAPARYSQYTEAIDAAKASALGGRVAVFAPAREYGLPANIGMVAGIDAAGGAHFHPSREQSTWVHSLCGSSDGEARERGTDAGCRIECPRLLDLMAARVVLMSGAPSSAPAGAEALQEGFRRVMSVKDVGVMVNDDALPRAYWVPVWQVVGDTAEAIEALCSPEFDAARTCVVEDAGPCPVTPSPELPTRNDAVCSFESPFPERVIVRVEAPDDGITVLCDAPAPGWAATLDGAPCRILKTNGMFRGVQTPAGQHEIVFTYKPAPFRVGAALSIATLALVSLLGAVALLRR